MINTTPKSLITKKKILIVRKLCERLRDTRNISAFDACSIPKLTQPITRFLLVHNFYCALLRRYIYFTVSNISRAWKTLILWGKCCFLSYLRGSFSRLLVESFDFIEHYGFTVTRFWTKAHHCCQLYARS